MFEVGFSEILLIMVIALVVLGPEKLPKLAADVGRWMGRARSMARQLRTQLDQEVQLDEMLREQKKSAPPPPAPPPAANAVAGTGAIADASVVPPAAAVAAFVNPPAVGPGAPEIGAPTDELHSHGPDPANGAAAAPAWDDPSLAPSPHAAEPAPAGAAGGASPTSEPAQHDGRHS